MAFNHPSSSKNNTGVIINHHSATLPGPQPLHDSDSHKQEIPANSIQFVTTNNASSNCSCSRPYQSFFHFSQKHEWSSLNWIRFTGRLSPPPNQSLSHFSQEHLVPPLRCIGFTGPSSVSVTHDFPGTNDANITRKFPSRRKKHIRKLQYYCYTGIRNYDQSTDTHSRPSRDKW